MTSGPFTMRPNGLSIFRRLLSAMAVPALLVAIVSGGAHYLFAVGLIETSVRAQIDAAPSDAIAFLERTYAVPVSGDLRLLESSPVVDDLLVSMGPQRFLDRPEAEGMFLSLVRAKPGLYTDLSLLDTNGEYRVSVMFGRRIRAEHLEPSEHPSALFRELSTRSPGTVLYRGPLHHADGRYSMLVVIGKRDPGLGTFGGAIIAEVPLDAFVAHLAAARAFGHATAWLLEADGALMLTPPASASRLDPRPYLGSAQVPRGTVVRVSALESNDSPLGLFRVALSLPQDVFSSSMSTAGTITAAVLVVVILASCLFAWLAARRIAHPIRALYQLAVAVGSGDLSRRIHASWGGEEGRLGDAFNRMLDALDATTVSRAYVNSILESMGDAVIVVSPQGAIETVNRAACVLLGVDAQELIGSRLDPLLPCVRVREQLGLALAAHQGFEQENTPIRSAHAGEVPVWLSCVPMHDADGTHRGMVVVARGIRESLSAKRALEAAHRTLSFHVENSPLAVIEWDPQFRVHLFDDHDDLDRRRGEAQWGSRINDALDEDRFFLMAQPIVPFEGAGSVEWFELLLRMTDEDGRVVAPGAFLPAAERYHLMSKLDRWVIRNAIGLIAAAPPARAGARTCFVNISGQTLADESLCDFVAEQLARSGVAPQALCFEITETAAVADFTRANAFIESLTALGCRFALDDFGTGASSFAYLKNLPVHFLKIDGVFVRDIAGDPASLALVRSINEVAHAMGKRTVAEFVENEAVLELLSEVGVDYAQGFHLGRPMLAAGVLAARELAATG